MKRFGIGRSEEAAKGGAKKQRASAQNRRFSETE
jgi:hypothetical protein